MSNNDPAHYRRMSEPFHDAVSANDALAAFFEDVKAARDRHRIADVVVLCEVSYSLDGDEVRGSARCTHGDSASVLPMLAREFGAEQAAHQERIAKIMATARKAARK